MGQTCVCVYAHKLQGDKVQEFPLPLSPTPSLGLWVWGLDHSLGFLGTEYDWNGPRGRHQSTSA